MIRQFLIKFNWRHILLVCDTLPGNRLATYNEIACNTFYNAISKTSVNFVVKVKRIDSYNITSYASLLDYIRSETRGKESI